MILPKELTMPADALIIQRSARKKLFKLPINIHKKIISSLEIIKAEPISGTKLGGVLGKYYKYPVGDYRIVYSFDKKNSTVHILKIEHRQGVYK